MNEKHAMKNRPPGTPWMRLAVLFNLLSRLDTRQVEITTEPKEGLSRYCVCGAYLTRE